MDTIVAVIKDKGSFPRAWEKGIDIILNNGIEIDFGDETEKKKARDTDLTLVLSSDALAEAINGVLHKDFPTRNLHLMEYLKQWERGYDWEKQGFDYNYNYRAAHYNTYYSDVHLCTEYPGGLYTDTSNNCERYIDQWELARNDIKKQKETGISSNRNVITISDPTADRFQIPHSPPCLLNMWSRWEKGDGISLKALYRSWDFYTASMSNIPGILNAVMREIVNPNDCYIKQFIIRSYSAHIYEGDLDAASKICKTPLSPRAMSEPCRYFVL